MISDVDRGEFSLANKPFDIDLVLQHVVNKPSATALRRMLPCFLNDSSSDQECQVLHWQLTNKTINNYFAIKIYFCYNMLLLQ